MFWQIKAWLFQKLNESIFPWTEMIGKWGQYSRSSQSSLSQILVAVKKQWIHSEARTWHDKNIQSNAPNRQILRTQLNIWPVCQTGWVFVCELSGSGFKSSCNHLNFRFRTCFEQGVPWHSGNYRVWIHCETRTWHDKNIQLRRGIYNARSFNKK